MRKSSEEDSLPNYSTPSIIASLLCSTSLIMFNCSSSRMGAFSADFHEHSNFNILKFYHSSFDKFHLANLLSTNFVQ